MNETKNPIADLSALVRRLRGPEGCPWDREQDERSIVPHTVEEAYELADAAASGDDRHPYLVSFLEDAPIGARLG